jgi:hypothetical protein
MTSFLGAKPDSERELLSQREPCGNTHPRPKQVPAMPLNGKHGNKRSKQAKAAAVLTWQQASQDFSAASQPLLSVGWVLHLQLSDQLLA